MLGTIYIGLSGMNAYSKGLEVISNNVANLNTPGFKLTEPSFNAALYQSGGSGGVAVDTEHPSFGQGELRDTGNSMDAGIDGGGFFVLERDGQHLFTRAGQFEFDNDGTLVDRTTGGNVLVSTDSESATSFNLSEFRTLPPTATTEVQVAGTLARTGTATTFDMSNVNVVDASGNTIALKVKFTRTAADPLVWAAEVFNPDGVSQGTGTLKFNADGTPAQDANAFDVTVKPAGVPAFTIRLKFGEPGSYAGVTSIASSTTSQLTMQKQNGLTVGRLTGTSFDDQGRLTLAYSNGQKRTPATLLLARVTSPKQLRELGESLFTAAEGSTISLGTAGNAGNGRIVGGKVEASNVDLTQQFTTLIIIQRGYQASSQLTSVANEMMQQLLNMEQRK